MKLEDWDANLAEAQPRGGYRLAASGSFLTQTRLRKMLSILLMSKARLR